MVKDTVRRDKRHPKDMKTRIGKPIKVLPSNTLSKRAVTNDTLIIIPYNKIHILPSSFFSFKFVQM
jgi:hypothetical protein